MEIECASAVSKVVVHARGALVTREVTLPADLGGGIVDVAVPGVTVAARAGSARAELEGSERLVVAVHTSVVVPAKEAKPGASVTKVRELRARHKRLVDEHGVLAARRHQLAQCALSPALRAHDGSKRPRDAIDVRFTETLAMAKLLAAKIADLDDRLFSLEREQRDVQRAIDAARLEDAQTSSQERMGAQQPTRRIVVRVSGDGAPGKLLVTYAVAAARWWPSYTLRIEDAGARATWTFEALVAQLTGEDWTAALLALSSADLVFDARLPELASLRFGRAQPSKRRPLRPAPAGGDDMFAAYLAFRPLPPIVPGPPPARTIAPADADDDEATAVRALPESAPRLEAARPSKKEAYEGAMASFGAPPGAAPMSLSDTGAPPPPPPAMQGAPMAMRARGGVPAPAGMVMPAMAKSAGLFGAAFGGGGGGGDGGADAYELGAFAAAAAEPEPELVLGEQWSDLDALVLAGAEHPRRGKLVPQRSSFDRTMFDLDVSLLSGAAKARWVDPLESRGMFDHRYEAAGRADVPSDGRVHRVGVATMPCNVLIAWRTVPSEATEVYREANVINPFDQALLGGPVDVYLDGSLLAETTSTRIDRGGTLWCGMGVDDRVKVARNVRAEEESAGLLGGSLAVTHTVSIELTSAIKDPIKVVVLERVPVTDDKAIEIKLVRAAPQPVAYDQAERGEPVRGGQRFDVAVTPGKPASLEIVYRLVFASKLDIVGGSRRG
ncbi:MAG: DUF4139 domain-containing protein [Labilithrix sp.]|nr:DUF4139 domain-containing protein [Labilithrix sp.]MCW5815601.1 DUF4139 domain-containing protein [Labilithrix sp.]